MLGFPSLTKLLVLAAIVLAVWYGFKLIGRLDAQRKLQAKQQERAAAAGRATAVPDAEEMIACAACGAYVPARLAGNCGRADCPY
ncbi:MAG TPA: hypothetical protein VKY54_13370 [Kiloniellales bacterium]|jgi:hypothetical protein|nr:hypothetical protein [Kiloniellales bacterium]